MYIKTVEVERIPGSITVFSEYYCTIQVTYKVNISGTFGFKTLNEDIRDCIPTGKMIQFDKLIKIIESEKV